MMLRLLLLLTLAGHMLMVIPAEANTTTTSPAGGTTSAERYLDAITPDNAPDAPLGFRASEIRSERDVVPLAQRVISTVTGFLAAIAGTYGVIMLIKQSYILVTSNGDTQKSQDARNGIIWAILGLLGIMFSYLIIFTVVDTLFRIGSGAGL